MQKTKKAIIKHDPFSLHIMYIAWNLCYITDVVLAHFYQNLKYNKNKVTGTIILI